MSKLKKSAITLLLIFAMLISISIPAYAENFSNIKTTNSVAVGTMPVSGTVKIPVFCIYPNGATPSANEITSVRNMFFDKSGQNLNYSGPIASTGDSLSGYIYRSSYGKLNVEGNVFVYNTQNDMSKYFSDDDVLDEIVRYLDIEWSDYDANNDGYVDGVYLCFMTDPSFITSACTYTKNMSLSSSEKLCKYVVTDSFQLSPRTIIHEFYHLIGLADCYAGSGKNPSGTGASFVLDSATDDIPGIMKYLIGWINNPVIVTSSNTYTINSLSEKGSFALVYPHGDTNSKEVFAIDYPTLKNNFQVEYVRIWRVDLNLTSDFNFIPSSGNIVGNMQSPYTFIELVHDTSYVYFLKKGSPINSGTAPSLACYTEYQVANGKKTPIASEDSGIQIELINLTQSAATLKIDITPREIVEEEHVAAKPVWENIDKEPNCTETGIGDKVTYCADCGEELSREVDAVIPAKGHTPLTAAEENHIEAKCEENGGYDMVVRCAVCHEVISSEHTVTKAIGHNWVDIGQSNRVDPTCTDNGGYEKNYKCTNCENTKSEHVVIKALGHKDADKDGECDACGKILEEKSSTPTFITRIVNFFNSIFDFFRNLFK